MKIKKNSKYNRVFILFFIIFTIVFLYSFYKIRSNNITEIGEQYKKNNSKEDESKIYKTKFYIDGWSYLSLKNQNIIYNTRTVLGDIKTGKVIFKPLPATEYNQILSQNPDFIERLISYLLSASSNIKCKITECVIDNYKYNVYNLSDLSKNNSYSSIYKGFGIKDSIYYAEIFYNSGEIVSIVSPRGDIIELNTINNIDNLNISEDISSKTKLYSYAFGRFFENNPLWRNGVERWSIPRLENSSIFSKILPIPSKPLNNGLGDTSRNDIFALSDNILTYISSPVTGCGVLAICIPGSIKPVSEIVNINSKMLCSKDGKSVYVDSIENKVSLVLTSPSHLYGIWNGYNGDDSLLGYKAEPYLSGGQIDFINNIIIIKNSRNEIIDFIGQRGQIGIDNNGYIYNKFIITNKSINKLFNGYFRIC